MKHAAGLLSLALALTVPAQAWAQGLLVSAPLGGGAFSVARGLGFTYQRRNLSVSGYVSSRVISPYGPGYYVLTPYAVPATTRVTIISYAPRPVVLAPADDDVSGVDLDL